MGRHIRDECQMKALTGLSQAQFDSLLPVCSDTTDNVLGTQCAMARSRTHENLHKLSPMLYDTLVHLELMPYRELATPEEWKAALPGVDRLLIDATERA